MPTRVIRANKKCVSAGPLLALLLAHRVCILAQTVPNPNPPLPANERNWNISTRISATIFENEAHQAAFSKALRASFTALPPAKNISGFEYSALEVRPVTAAQPSETGSPIDQARYYLQHNEREKALAKIEQAEEQNKSGNNPKMQASVLDLKATAFMFDGEFEKAIDVYRQAMVLERSLNDLNGQAEMFLRVGWAYQSLANYPKALGCYGAARDFFEKSGDKGGVIRARISIRSTYQSMGDVNRITQAENWVAMGASKDQAATVLASDAQFLLASNLPSLWNLSLERYKEALALMGSSPDPKLETRIFAGMGRSETVLGFRDQAGKHLELALSKTRLAGDREAEAATLASLGNLEVYTALSRKPNSEWTGGSSSVVPSKKHLQAALDRYSEALNLMREDRDRRGELGVLAGMAVSYNALGKYSDALNSCVEAITLLESIEAGARLEAVSDLLAEKASGLYEQAIFSAMKLKQYEEAFNLTERARASSFRGLVGEADVTARSTLAPEFVKQDGALRQENVMLERQLGQELSKPDADIDEKRVVLLKTRLETVRAEELALSEKLRKTSPDVAAYFSVPVLTLNEIQNKLDADTTLISYFSYFPESEEILAFIVSKNRFHAVELFPDDPGVLNGNTVSYTSSMASLPVFTSQIDSARVFEPLYKLLIKPIRHQLQTKALLVVPYGHLYNLPFEALSPDGVHYLGDEYTVTYLPSASDVSYLGHKGEGLEKRMLVLSAAMPNGQSQAATLSSEAKAVASLYGTEPRISGDAAVSFASLLRDEGPKADLVHIVTPSGITPPGVLPDGRCKVSMPVAQVAGLDLTRTSLVVVSGWECERNALNEAFLYAGAHSVITSLWSVDSNAAESFMVSFYSYLRSGKTKAESLRAAQMETRRAYPHPYYWAGFVLSGAQADETGNAQQVSAK